MSHNAQISNALAGRRALRVRFETDGVCATTYDQTLIDTLSARYGGGLAFSQERSQIKEWVDGAAIFEPLQDGRVRLRGLNGVKFYVAALERATLPTRDNPPNWRQSLRESCQFWRSVRCGGLAARFQGND